MAIPLCKCYKGRKNTEISPSSVEICTSLPTEIHVYKNLHLKNLKLGQTYAVSIEGGARFDRDGSPRRLEEEGA